MNSTIMIKKEARFTTNSFSNESNKFEWSVIVGISLTLLSISCRIVDFSFVNIVGTSSRSKLECRQKMFIYQFIKHKFSNTIR